MCDIKIILVGLFKYTFSFYVNIKFDSRENRIMNNFLDKYYFYNLLMLFNIKNIVCDF